MSKSGQIGKLRNKLSECTGIKPVLRSNKPVLALLEGKLVSEFRQID
jgi:hypothetical protein